MVASRTVSRSVELAKVNLLFELGAKRGGEKHVAVARVAERVDDDLKVVFVEEAIGVVKAVQAHATPVAISFTLETDGRLPSGETLEHAIMKTDAETALYAAYYMINCAHPTHFAHVLADNPPWSCRIRGLRANASTRSHAELDASTDLDTGDPEKLAIQYRALAEVLPALNVVGGCCGTDDRHVDRICSVLTASQGIGDSLTVVGTASPRARRSMFT